MNYSNSTSICILYYVVIEKLKNVGLPGLPSGWLRDPGPPQTRTDPGPKKHRERLTNSTIIIYDWVCGRSKRRI